MIQMVADRADFNPLPPCGGRLLDLALASRYPDISIHSLRVEGDATSLTRPKTQ